MNTDYAQDCARRAIKELAKTPEEENMMVRGMLIMIDALNGEL